MRRRKESEFSLHLEMRRRWVIEWSRSKIMSCKTFTPSFSLKGHSRNTSRWTGQQIMMIEAPVVIICLQWNEGNEITKLAHEHSLWSCVSVLYFFSFLLLLLLYPLESLTHKECFWADRKRGLRSSIYFSTPGTTSGDVWCKRRGNRDETLEAN